MKIPLCVPYLDKNELEAVKKLAQNRFFMKEAGGKVVKVVSHLLRYLPVDFHYKVLFVNRDIREIIVSQQKMIGKQNAPYPLALENKFRAHLQKISPYLHKKGNMDVLHLQYTGIIENPLLNAARISDFLEADLDIESMAKVVSPELYRNKNVKGN